ncbi:MAG: cyclopropane-fatty-acyl-phospholipid synthase family protein [Hyphomicrobiaceae bacterium]
MYWLLDTLLRRVVETGRLDVVDADGRRHAYGTGRASPVVMRLHDHATETRLGLDPEMALGESYMSGALTVEGGDIYDLLALLQRNVGCDVVPGWAGLLQRVRLALRTTLARNTPRRSRTNVEHHYDIDDRIYALFLDGARQYSCGYFPRPGMDLEAAQIAKMDHIAAKLALAPGRRVLDIGSGWGGLACHLAETHEASVTGITLSPSQLDRARARAAGKGLAGKVSFALEDYRQTQGPYERIVSVGMLEHVGAKALGAYFRQIARLLTQDGIALVHTIVRSDGPGITNPFVARYIFPGGYSPALSELMPAIERAGLMVSDIEILRLHYAETLRHWRARFTARREEAVRLKGEPFCRMWEFYLAGAEAGFRHQGLVVAQIQLTRSIDALPIVRDYMVDGERALAARRWRAAEDGRRWPLAGE